MLNLRTSKPAMLLRNAGRTIGINGMIARRMAGDGYEERFRRRMLGAVRPGDIVWDVGANVGLYSIAFADLTGPSGQVIAFEPSPLNRMSLEQAVASRPNVVVLPVALGERSGTAVLVQGTDTLGATSRIAAADVAGPGHHRIDLASGDELLARGTVPFPAVIKVDTEGYEPEVLRGLRTTLLDRRLSTICVEVHFGILSDRGLAGAPADIERALLSIGFDVTWPDPSHVVASRTR